VGVDQTPNALYILITPQKIDSADDDDDDNDDDDNAQ
jgi:hypothetical protein